MRCRKLLLLVLLMSASTALFGRQSADSTKEISGEIVDAAEHLPLKDAVVILLAEDGKSPAKMNVTNEKGQFIFKNVPPGAYSLNVSFTGYQQLIIPHIDLTAAGKALGSLQLQRSTKDLQTVTVTGKKPVIENKIDRLIYNAAVDQTTTTGDATDLMRKVPMVSVDSDGNLALRGNRNVRVLLNGKPTGAMAGNIGDILQAIPASQIQSVEVMVSPSAKYDAEGLGGIINIITRRKVLEGINGAVSAGIGTRQFTGNASLNAKLRKLTLSANGGISNKWPRDIGINAYNYDNKGDSSSSRGNSINSRFSNNSSITAEYDFNDRNSVSSTFRSTSMGYSDDMHVNARVVAPGEVNEYSQATKGKFSSSGFDWNTDYLLKLDGKGQQLDLAVQWSNNSSEQKYRNIYSSYIPSQDAANHGKNNEYTLQLDYTLPVNEKIKLETGAKGIFRDIKSLYDYNIIGPQGELTYDSVLSNDYRYKQDVYAGYLVLNFHLNKGWDIQAGNRFEITRINGRSENIKNGLLPFSNQYNSYIPSLMFMKSVGENQSFKLSYSRRIQRPSLQFLNPFRNTSDPLNHTEGTPTLSPEQEQTVEFGYNLGYKIFNLSAAVYYKQVDDLIDGFARVVPYTSLDPEGNEYTRMVTLTNYGNIGKNRSVGLNVYSSLDFPNGFRLSGSLDLYTYHPEVKDGYDVYVNSGTFLMHNGFVSASYNYRKKLHIEANYSFQSRWRTFQGTAANLNVLNIGVKRDILKGKGSIGVVAVNIFKDNWNFTNEIRTPNIVQYRDLSTPFRSFNLNFSYKFGNVSIKAANKRGVKNDDLK